MPNLVRAFSKTHFIQSTQPTDGRVEIGSLWSKVGTGELYICTAIGPITFVLLTGGAGAPTSSAYVTIGADATLTGERALTAGTGISITDNGANGTVVIAATGAAAALSYQRTMALMGA